MPPKVSPNGSNSHVSVSKIEETRWTIFCLALHILLDICEPNLVIRELEECSES
jgi:hypothetical protein